MTRWIHPPVDSRRTRHALPALLGLTFVLGLACSAPAGTPSSTPLVAPKSTIAPTAALTELIPIKAAYPQAQSVQGAAFVAKEEGFFGRRGLDVELSRIGGPAQAAALLAGELQFGMMGANEVASAVLNGGPLVMLATCSDLPVFSLYADKKYTTVQELSGQSIIGSGVDELADRHQGVG